jgi:phage terminase Nu1 subunit (DNA packaging protein)
MNMERTTIPPFFVSCRRLRSRPTGRQRSKLEATSVRTLSSAHSRRRGHNFLTQERARCARKQADSMALKNVAMRGELIPPADVERRFVSFCVFVRAKILAIASQARSKLYACRFLKTRGWGRKGQL